MVPLDKRIGELNKEDCLRVKNIWGKGKKLVGDEDMEEMYGGAIEGDILNQCYKVKTCGDLVNH